ncbi:MAG: hypothetical protein QW416_02820 [Candidatus Nitrosocaldaceae archaeon]
MTSVISLRVPAYIKDILELEGEQEYVNTNVLIHKILKKYVEWERFADKVRFLPVPRGSYKSMISLISEKDLMNLALENSEIKSLTVLRRGEYNIDTLLDTLTQWLIYSGLHIRYIESPEQKLIISHDLGKNWSMYFEALVSNLIKDFDTRITSTLHNENSLSIVLERPKRSI